MCNFIYVFFCRIILLIYIRQPKRKMASNHGQTNRDLIGGNLQIKGKTVIDSNRDATFKNLKVNQTLTTSGALTAESVTVSNSVAGGIELITATGGGAYVLDPTPLLNVISNTDGANTGTLADGEQGQLKTIVAPVVTAGSFVLTPTNFNNGTTITFDAAGESATLIWAAGSWHVLALNGATVA